MGSHIFNVLCLHRDGEHHNQERSCVGSIPCLYACRDGWWLDLRCDSITFIPLGSLDSEGFILEGCVLRIALGRQLFNV